jgi:hypothetical protein
MHAAAAVTASLTIVFSPGDGGAAKRSTLDCPAATTDCRKLAQLPSDWYAPVPDGIACSEIFGGPQTARVHGTYRGRRIWVRFTRRNGCEIARWNRAAFLFPTRS